MRVPMWDLSGLSPSQREQQARQIVAQQRHRPFDLERGPVWRAELVRMGSLEHILGVSLHHVVSDGWSVGVMVKEMSRLYEAYANGRESTLEELEIQYADYAAWQREWLEGEVMSRQMQYWRKQLGDAPRLEMPTDKVRAEVRTNRGGGVDITIGEELSERVKEMSRREGVTIFMTVMAAYQVVLSRFCGQDDIVIGTDVANRNRLETEGLIGFFVNQLVVRTDLRGNPSLREVLRRVRAVTLEAYENQDLPFEKLVEDLAPERDMNRSPLFQVKFVLQNAETEPLRLDGLALSLFEPGSDKIKLYMNLIMLETASGLSGTLKYSTDLFEPETAKHLVDHLELALKVAVVDIERRIGDISLLTESEQWQVLMEWNQTASEYGVPRPVHELFEKQAERIPDAIAVVYEDQEISYGGLNKEANRLAHYLAKLGVGAEVRVALCMERSVEMVIGLLAVLKAGGAYVPLDWNFPPERQRQMLEDSQTAVVLTQERLRGRLPAYWAQVVSIDSDRLDWADESEANLDAEVMTRNLAYVIYTSGSTGRPKAVGIEHAQIVNYVSSISYRLDLSPGWRLALLSSLAADLGYTMLFPSLCLGSELHIVADLTSRDSSLWALYLSQRRIDCLKITPSHFQALLTGSNSIPANRLILGGEVCSRELINRVRRLDGQCRLYNHYGPTECTVGGVVSQIDDDQEGRVAIGKAIGNVRGYVTDQAGEPVMMRAVGELLLGGSGVGRGYVNDAGATGERFVPDALSGERGARLYRTGDLVRRRPVDAELEFLGRVDHQVKVRGYRIEPGEIEAELMKLQAIKQCAVMVKGDSDSDKRLVAYIVPLEGEAASSAQISKLLEQRLPAYMVPSVFVVINEMPLTVNGKVDRKRLPEPDERPEVDGEQEDLRARSAIEEIVGGIWAEVLKLRRVGLDENFFEKGGHSLLATQVMSRVREVMGVEVGLREMFERPTVRGLSEAIEKQRAAGRGREVPAMKRREREAELELSYAQQRLWFINELEPESAAYNIAYAVRMQGEVNEAALEQCMNEIVRRHEVLRTRFVSRAGKAHQLIDEPRWMRLPMWDLSGLSQSQRELQARQIVAQQRHRPFDLERGPVWRAELVRMGSLEHILGVSLHHVVSDGWSVGVMVKEMSRLYEAYANGRESTLEELEIQYADYAAWQREWLEGEVMSRQMQYWRKQLGDAPRLEMPTDKVRAEVRTNRGGGVDITIGEELSERVKEMSRREGVTIFMTVMAAYQVVLSRFCGQDDISVGTPIANRNRLETEGLIGFFVNQLVVRTDLRGNPSLREVLRRVRAVTLEAYENQDLPFEMVVEEIRPEREMRRTPLAQVELAVQNAREGALELKGVEISAMGVGGAEAKFELAVVMREGEEGIRGVAEYREDLYERVSIERIAEHLVQVLERMVEEPEVPMGSIELLRECERQQLLLEWNDTQSEFEQQHCPQQLFEQQVEATPDAVAVGFEDQQLSYGELNRLANQLAHHLLKQGVGPEHILGVCLERSPQLVVAILGVVKAGAAYMPLDPYQPRQRLSLILRQAGARLLVSEHSLLGLFETAAEVVCLDTDWGEIEQMSQENPATQVERENLIYVIYTSGSTGVPKGVAIEQRGLVNLISWHKRAYAMNSRQRTTQVAGLGFDASVWEMWPSLVSGASLWMVAEQERNSGEEIMKWLQSRGVTISFLPTPMAEEVLALESEAEGALRKMLTGGDRLQRYAERGKSYELVNHYGPTEASVVATCGRVEEQSGQEEAPTIGRPIDNTRIYLMDRQKNLAPIGARGEIHIGGAGLARGYVNEAGMTAEKFIPDELGGEYGKRVYATGDLGRYEREGRIRFEGRADNQVKMRGYRIELGEVETVMRQKEGVEQAVAVVREGGGGQRRLVGYVVGKEWIDKSELKKYMRGRLPDYMVPGVIVQIEQMPLTPNGKIDRQALPKSDAEIDEESCIGPRNEVEEILCGIWEKLLRVDRAGVTDNFFALGGDSILSIQVIARAREAGVYLTPRQFFEHQTIAELAQIASGPKLMEAEQGVLTGQAGLTPIQRAFFGWGLSNPHHYNQSVILEVKQGIKSEMLEKALTALVRHHDVLRMRFEEQGNGWSQRYGEPEEGLSLWFRDLSGMPEGEQRKALQADAAQVQASLNVKAGPLARAVEYDLGGGRRWLLLVIHHLTVDGVSWRILLEDLERAYEQLARGEAVKLPAKTTSFRRWAERLQQHSQREEMKREVEYWLSPEWEQVSATLPVDEPLGENKVGSSRTISVWLSELETQALLQEVTAAYHAQINDVLLTSLTQAYKRWTGESSVLIELEGHGREDIFEDLDLSRTVGWFTTIFPVRLRLGSAHPGEALKQIKEQLRAIPKRGLGFGLMRYLSGDAQVIERLRSIPQPEISFNYLGQFDQVFLESSLFKPTAESAGSSQSLENHRRSLLGVNVLVINGRMRIDWTYSENIHRKTTIEELGKYFVESLRALSAHCHSPEAGGYTPSDFPDANLTQDELTSILARLGKESVR